MAAAMGTGATAVPIDKAVGYVNPFLRENSTIAIKNGAVFWQNGYCSGGERLGITN